MTAEGRSRVRKALSIAASVIFLAAWIGGGVWYFGFDKSHDPCASLRYQDDAAYRDCERGR
jgi:hypothetical protein